MLAAVLFPATLSWLAAGAPRRAPIPLMDASSVDQAFAAQGTKLDAKSKLMEGLKRECEPSSAARASARLPAMLIFLLTLVPQRSPSFSRWRWISTTQT